MKSTTFPFCDGGRLFLHLFLLLGTGIHVQAAVGSGSVMTVAGNGGRDFQGDGGPATNAALQDPLNIAFGPDGTLYIGDSSNYRIRAVSPVTGLIRTVAGN